MASSPPSEVAQGSQQPIYPLYNKTYPLHRLSPLHNLSSLSPASLTQHARRLLSILRGDVLRGVRVGFESIGDGVVNAGRLESCEWKLLANAEAWERQQHADEAEQEDNMAKETAGVWIELEYEKTNYTALLLRNPRPRRDRGNEASAAPAEEGEIHLPLLLTHMPSALRSTLQDYLTTTFDARIEETRLSSTFLAAALEGFLADLSPLGAAGMAKVVKDLQITLAFRIPVTPSLRTLDVTIRREDVWGFLVKGKSTAAGKDGGGAKAFMSALGGYLKAHLALDITHEDVRVSKVACGGFVLARDGRAKIMGTAEGGVEGDEGETGRRAFGGLMGRLFERAEVWRFEDGLGG